MSLSLTLGSFLGLEAGQVQGLQACRVQLNNGQSIQETEDTPGSAEMLRSKDWGWKVVGAILMHCMWGPKVAEVIPGWLSNNVVCEGCGGDPKSCVTILGWPSTSMWGPVVAVLDEWGLPGEYGDLIDTPKAVGETLATFSVG